MPATGYTPISLYYSATSSTVAGASTLVNGELFINITDGKLYYKDNTGTVQLIASKNLLSLNGGTIAGDGTNIIHRTNGVEYFQNNSGSNLAYIDASGNFTAIANVTAYSDERLKSDIKTIPNALDAVDKLRGVSFVKDEKPSIGVIAQEVQQVFPELVLENADGYLSVAYGNLVGVLIEAVKELRAEVKALKGE